MANLTYAQLEGQWIAAGGSAALAPMAAAIAEAESGGDPTKINANDTNGKGGTQSSWGLWQISNGTHTAPSPNWNNPLVNAQLAVAKYNAAGGWSPWGTYVTGAYKAYLSNSTSPDTSPLTGDAALTQATSAAGAPTGTDSDCAWGIGFGGIPGTSWLTGIFGSGGGNLASGEVCIISKPQVRGVVGVLVIIGGLSILVQGLSIIAVTTQISAASKIFAVITGGGKGKSGGAAAGAGAAADTGAAAAPAEIALAA